MLTLLALLAGALLMAPGLHAQSELDRVLDPANLLAPPTAVDAPVKQPTKLATSRDVVAVSTQWSRDAASPGSRSVIAVTLSMDDHYHINPDIDRLPEDTTLIATSVTFKELPAGVRVGMVQYPEPIMVKVNYTGQVEDLPAYEGDVTLYVPVTIGDDVPAGTYDVTAAVRFQSCNETSCLFPATANVTTTLTVDAAATGGLIDGDKAAAFAGFNEAAFDAVPQPKSADVAPTDATTAKPLANRIDAFGYGFDVGSLGFWLVPMLLVTAFVGGLLLNFTPCVLPVIPLKIMSLNKTAGDRTRTLLLGTAMSAGVVMFWLGLGVAMTVVSGFQATSQLFGYWWFSIPMGLVIIALAVGMCGLFSVQLPQMVYRITPRQDSVGGSIGFGVMTAILSTPCTAPFMGGAAAAALTLPTFQRLIIFATIGLGMAVPYFVLSAYPKLVDRMPRTGPASELIKQVMGLLMLAAGAYFAGVGVVSIFADGTSQASQLYWWPVAACIFAAGGWLVYRTFVVTRSMPRRATFAALGVLLAGSCYFLVPIENSNADTATDPLHIDWVYYTPQRFAEAQQRGDVVLMDFTAEWCINCKVLEATVLRTEPVASLTREPNVVAMKVDLTGSNDPGRALLQEMGAVAIPFLVVFDGNGQPVFRGDSYSVGQVVQAIETARAVRVASR
jgi:thiol:disulfide interchange protein DsbD